MIKKFKCPDTYIQGRDVLSDLGEYTEHLGSLGLTISDEVVMEIVEPLIEEAFESSRGSCIAEVFNGECTYEEIGRIASIAEEKDVDFVMGAGGGKTLDTAKAVGNKLEIPFVCIPTVASTDSPTSYQSVVYTEEGEFVELIYHDRHPRLVVVDTRIIAEAPTRMFVSGVGDALATWFEARTCYEAGNQNEVGGMATGAALSLAELCYDNLRKYAEPAVEAVKSDRISPAVETLIESNVLLSGLGFENGGLAAAHSIHNGLTVSRRTHDYLHGEKVAFGTLVQLTLENTSGKELKDLMEFCTSVGLPVSLEELGLSDPDEATLRKIAAKAVAKGESIHHEPFPMTAEAVADAIATTDMLGRKVLGEG